MYRFNTFKLNIQSVTNLSARHSAVLEKSHYQAHIKFVIKSTVPMNVVILNEIINLFVFIIQLLINFAVVGLAFSALFKDIEYAL